MSLLLITTLLVSGLGSLFSSVPRQFHLVKELKSWTEAQQYCREDFTDLATIHNMTENEKVNSTIHEAGVEKAWIGPKTGDLQFTNWDVDQPNEGDEECVVMTENGKWHDFKCNKSFPSICYDDKLVLVPEIKTWTEALRYCRDHHVDLVSVTSEQVQRWVRERAKGASTDHVWVGLHNVCGLGWFWVCGETVCYSNWSSEPEQVESCEHRVGAVESGGGQWVSNLTETDKFNFICTTEEQ